MTSNLESEQLSDPSSGRVRIASAAIGMIGIVGLVYSGSFGGVYVFDDYLIFKRGFVNFYETWEQFWSSSRQLVNLSFVANHRINELDPWGYHLVNLIVHLISVLCVFSLGIWVTRRWAEFRQQSSGTTDRWPISIWPISIWPISIWPAWWIALLWGIHPLTTESVTYIIQRYESTAVMFMLLTLRCWCGVLAGKRPAVVGVFVFAWCAILSKQISVSLPFLIIAWDQFFVRLHHPSDVQKSLGASYWSTRLVGFAAIMTAWSYLILRLSGYLREMISGAEETELSSGQYDLNPLEYLATQSVVILHYLKLVVFPKDLRLDYGWSPVDDPWRYVPAMLLLATIACFGIWAFHRRKLSGLLIVLTYLTLAPRSSFAPSPDMVFEHRMHFPLVFLISLLVVAGVCIHRASSAKRWLIPFVGTCLLILWSYRTHMRNLDYHSPVGLWLSNYELEPQNPRVAHALCNAYAGQGQWDLARMYATKAVQLDPQSPVFHSGLGDTLRQTGQLELAIESYDRAIELSPDLWPVYVMRGYVHQQLGHSNIAENDFRTAAEAENAAGVFSLARLLETKGQLAEALELCNRLLADKNTVEPVINLRTRIIQRLTDAEIR